MNKLSKDKRDKLILICIIIAGALGALYTFVLAAQKETLDNYQTKIDSLTDRIARAERLKRSGARLREQMEEIRVEIERHHATMAPPGQYYYWFFKLLEDFREREGFQDNFIHDLAQPEFAEVALIPAFPYKAAIFNVGASGYFDEIGRFLAAFENTYPFMRIERIRLQPDLTGALSALEPGARRESKPAATEKLILEMRVVTMIKPSGS